MRLDHVLCLYLRYNEFKLCYDVLAIFNIP